MSLSGYLLLTTAAGVGLAFQAVINARLSAALGSPLWATVVQVIVGLLMLIVVVGATRQATARVRRRARRARRARSPFP